MFDIVLNKWQRGVLLIAAALLFAGALVSLSEAEAKSALLPFLWGVFLLTLSLSPRKADQPTGDPQ